MIYCQSIAIVYFAKSSRNVKNLIKLDLNFQFKLYNINEGNLRSEKHFCQQNVVAMDTSCLGYNVMSFKIDRR